MPSGGCSSVALFIRWDGGAKRVDEHALSGERRKGGRSNANISDYVDATDEDPGRNHGYVLNKDDAFEMHNAPKEAVPPEKFPGSCLN